METAVIIDNINRSDVMKMVWHVKEYTKMELVGIASQEEQCKMYCQNMYADYRKMLEELKPDFAFVITDVEHKHEILKECESRGIRTRVMIQERG